MKLTKSQRLFIEAGESLAKEKELKRILAMGFTTEHTPSSIAAHKRRKKELIREAVRAADEELDEAWHEGLSVGMDWTI